MEYQEIYLYIMHHTLLYKDGSTKKFSTIKMLVSAKNDCHSKQNRRYDVTFIFINNYRREVYTCDAQCNPQNMFAIQ